MRLFLLGLSKGNALVEIPAWFFFFVRSQIAVKSSSRMRNLLSLTHARHFDDVMADEEKLTRPKISTDTVFKTLKTHTKYAHIVRGRPTLKDVEHFRNGSVREPHVISL